MTNDELWRQIAKLHGQTLRTVTGRGVFWVESISDDGVVILIGKNKTRRPLTRAQFETANKLEPKADMLKPSRIRAADISDWTPAYVAAILKAIGADRL